MKEQKPLFGLEEKAQREKFIEKIKSGENLFKEIDNYDQNQILEVLKDQQLLKVKNVKSFNNILTYIRKRKLTNLYETEYFKDVVSLIANNLNQLDSGELISAFSFSLFRMKYKQIEPYIQIEQNVRKNIENFDIESLANILYSFTYISRKQNLYDFSPFYKDLEANIAIKLRLGGEKINEKDLTQLLVAYSKSQNLSQEFCYVIDIVTQENLNKMKTREITSILYTLSLNQYFSKVLLENCMKNFLEHQEKFSLEEICHLLKACDLHQQNLNKENDQSQKTQINEEIKQIEEISDNKKFVDQVQNTKNLENNENELKVSLVENKEIVQKKKKQVIEGEIINEYFLKKVQKAFLIRKGSCNIQDCADLCEIFFKYKFVEEEFISQVREIFRVLRKNLDAQSLSKFFSNLGDLFNEELIPHRFLKELINSLIIINNIYPTKMQGFLPQIKKEAFKINHHHFKSQLIEVINGKVKLKSKEELINNKKEVNKKLNKKRNSLRRQKFPKF